jgi:hypothetical protein
MLLPLDYSRYAGVDDAAQLRRRILYDGYFLTALYLAILEIDGIGYAWAYDLRRVIVEVMEETGMYPDEIIMNHAEVFKNHIGLNMRKNLLLYDGKDSQPPSRQAIQALREWWVRETS